MYVSRTGKGYTVKRLPYSGKAHATGCASHGAVRPRDGRADRGRSIHRFGRRLAESSESTLVQLRHLWQRAGLAHWRTAFKGRRPWAVVRARLLKAAIATGTANQTPAKKVYIPEQFELETAEAITLRREALWKQLASEQAPTRPPLIIGELKWFNRLPAGTTVTVRHVPDVQFRIDEPEADWLHSRFATELLQWRSGGQIRLILAAVLDPSRDRAPAICSLALIAVDHRWVPITLLGPEKVATDATR